MKIHIDKTLRNFIDETYSSVRLRRNGVSLDPKGILPEILSDLETSGDAMRCLDRKGRIAWKPTPQFQSILADLQADAEADEEEEAM